MICLNMIVRNESEVIRRCLESVKGLIDTWVIVDTGSEDKTLEIILESLQGIPGELLQRPWVDFAHNRNEALLAAKGRAKYLLFIDADDRLVSTAPWSKTELDRHMYAVSYRKGDSCTKRILLVDSQLDWAWQGKIHETLVSKEAQTCGFFPQLYIEAGAGGFRSKNPSTLKDDLLLLRKSLEMGENPERTIFHLGVFSEEAGEDRDALYYFTKRASMGGWDQEIFYALFRVAFLQEKLQFSSSIFVESYKKAHAYRPSRIEPLVCLALYNMRSQKISAAYELLKRAKEAALSSDTIYVMHSLYKYGALLLFAEAASHLGKQEEAQHAYAELSHRPELPQELRTEIVGKLRRHPPRAG